MINKHIEIVRSSYAWLSSIGQESGNAMRALLSKHYSTVGVTTLNNLQDLKSLVASQPDLVVLGVKFVPENEALGLQDPARIWVANYLDEHDIAYTGSGQEAHMLELNKPLAKQCVLDFGLKTSPFHVVKQQQTQTIDNIDLAYPLFVKPADRGGGLGVNSDSVVHNFAELASKVHSIKTKYQSDSLIEEYLPGREFSVAILKNIYAKNFSLMPVELIAPADERGVRILSGQVKSADTESSLEVTDPIIKSKICTLAMGVFHALGARDYGRIDIRLDEHGTPHFLEANLIPSLIEGYGNFPKACMLNMSMDYETMLLHIMQLGLSRKINSADNMLDETAEDMPLLEPVLDAA